MKAILALAACLGLCACGAIVTREEFDAVKGIVGGTARGMFGPIGGLVADHSMELLLGTWMVKRKLGEKRRYEKVVAEVTKGKAAKA